MTLTIDIGGGSRITLQIDDLPEPAKAAICRAVGVPVEAFDWMILVKFFLENVLPILLDWFKNRKNGGDDDNPVAP